jgi:hypothetical protein
MHVNEHACKWTVFTCMFYMHVTKHACYMHVFTCMSDFKGLYTYIKFGKNRMIGTYFFMWFLKF